MDNNNINNNTAKKINICTILYTIIITLKILLLILFTINISKIYKKTLTNKISYNKDKTEISKVIKGSDKADKNNNNNIFNLGKNNDLNIIKISNNNAEKKYKYVHNVYSNNSNDNYKNKNETSTLEVNKTSNEYDDNNHIKDKTYTDDFIENEIINITKDITDKGFAAIIASQIRSRLHENKNSKNINGFLNYWKSSINSDKKNYSMLNIEEICVRLFDKGNNHNILSTSALYIIKADVIRGKLPIKVKITFFKETSPNIPLCYIDTIIYSLGKPIILKEISKCLNYGQIYRVCIESENMILYDKNIYIESPFIEMVPVFICQDVILLRYIKQMKSPIFNNVIYDSNLFTSKYIEKFPLLSPTLSTKMGQYSNNMNPISGNNNGHYLLYAKDPIEYDNSLPLKDLLSTAGMEDAELTLIKNPANPIEYYILLKRISQHYRLYHNIKGWIINYKSHDGTDFRQIFSLSSNLEKYHERSYIEIRSAEKLCNITTHRNVKIWNTDNKIGIEEIDNKDKLTEKKELIDNKIYFPKNPSFFHRDPYIVIDKETGKFIMLTFGFIDNISLNPRWAADPCYIRSPDNLITINPLRNDHKGQFISNVVLFNANIGGDSFTSNQGKAIYSSITVQNTNKINSPLLHLFRSSLPPPDNVFIHIQNDNHAKYIYLLTEVFHKSLPIQNKLDPNMLSQLVYMLGIKTPTLMPYNNKTYASVGFKKTLMDQNLYIDIVNMINFENTTNKLTIFALGLKYLSKNETCMPNVVKRVIRSSLSEEVIITDRNGTELTRSKNILVDSNGIIIISNDVEIDGSVKRWASSTPFLLGSCKISGRIGILGNTVPVFTVDQVLDICKIFTYSIPEDAFKVGYTVYLSNTCLNERIVTDFGISDIVALYLSPKIQGKRIILNTVSLTHQKNNVDEKNKIFIIPSKFSIGGGAEDATSLIILDRLVYALRAEIITDIFKEKQYFIQHGVYSPGSVTLDDTFVLKHRDIMNYNKT
uniref:Wsv216-like protein n=1 Tax=Trachysalambria curvirostris majanivirus TaxID=2984281 RepID=A0A9C7F0P8_9VIRU|nr:MAG: wsv216-like protein [Trachysalambria curvirostris majanivirus]